MIICKRSFIFDAIGYQTHRQNKSQISGRSLSDGRMIGSFQHGTEYSDSIECRGSVIHSDTASFLRILTDGQPRTRI
jgi:hypothetical protein